MGDGLSCVRPLLRNIAKLITCDMKFFHRVVEYNECRNQWATLLNRLPGVCVNSLTQTCQ